MRPSSGLQDAGWIFGATLATRTGAAGAFSFGCASRAGRAARASLARVAAATEAGVGWRRRGAGASEAEMVVTRRSPRPTAISGTRKLGSGRSGTTDTRGPEAGCAAAVTLAPFLPAAATRTG